MMDRLPPPQPCRPSLHRSARPGDSPPSFSRLSLPDSAFVRLLPDALAVEPAADAEIPDAGLPEPVVPEEEPGEAVDPSDEDEVILQDPPPEVDLVPQEEDAPIPAPAPDSIPVEFEADEGEGIAEEDRVILRGNARVTSEGREFRAQEITANTRTTEVAAEGNVVVTGDGRLLQGQRARGNLRDRTVSMEGDVTFSDVLQIPRPRVGPRDLPLTVRAEQIDYNFLKRTGSMRGLETTVQGLRVRGESGVLLPDQRLQIRGAEFSYCPVDEGERYGYSLRARQLDYDPAVGATARDTTLYIGNRRIVSLPYYRVDQGDGGGSANIPLPRIGSSRLAGSFVSFGFEPRLWENVVAQTRLELASKIGLRAFTTVRSVSGGPNPFLRVHLEEEVEGRDPKRLLIDRLPEFGFMLDPRSRSKWSRWVRGEVSYGYIHQHNPERRTGRGLISLQAQPIPLRDWGRWRMSVRPGIHLASYTSGDSYRDLYGEIAVARRWNQRRSVRAGVVKHVTGGSTPFKFDEALIPTELFTNLRWSAGAWGFGVNSRYDMGRGELFDARISVGKAIRCVEPRLVYSTRLRQIRLEVNLLGLTDLDDLPPAGSVPPPVPGSPAEQASACDACGPTVSR